MKRRLYFETSKPITLQWRVMGVSIVLVCILFTLILWYTLDSTNRQIAQDRLSSDASSALDLLETRVEVYGDVLYGTRALLLAQPNVTRTQWDAYMQSQSLFERYPGLNNIVYVEVAPNSEAATILAGINEARLDGEPVVKVYPETSTDRLGIIKYSTNPASQVVVGWNTFALDYIEPTLRKADALGVPTASPPFASRATARLGTNDFIIALAIYDETFRPEMSDAQKSAAVTGYAVASLHPETLFDAAVSSMRTTDEVYVQATNTTGSVVYETGNKLDKDYIERWSTINIGDEDWYITFRAPNTYELTPREIIAPSFFLIGGSLFMIMLVSIYFYRQGLRMKWREVAPRKTPEESAE